jgi:hypothetical protein
MIGMKNPQCGRTKWIVLGYLAVLGLIALIGMNLNKDTCEEREEEVAAAPSFVSRTIQFVTGKKQEEVAEQAAAPVVEDTYDPWKDRPKVGKPRMPRVITKAPEIPKVQPVNIPKVNMPSPPQQPQSQPQPTKRT